MTITIDEVEATLLTSVAERQSFDQPFRYHRLAHLFPKHIAEQLERLPFEPPDLAGVSGTREVHNATRRYFDRAALELYPVAKLVTEAFLLPSVCGAMAAAFGASLDATFLRLEYAQDVDGFWLAPHTDLGVKRLTCLIYLSTDPRHATLGTDLYASRAEHWGSVPFEANAALCFVPGVDTWHGFEKRAIDGTRRSMIVNYVTGDWRAKEQLASPLAIGAAERSGGGA